MAPVGALAPSLLSILDTRFATFPGRNNTCLRLSRSTLQILGLCQPQLALSADRRKYHWQVVPYETESFYGNMLYCRPRD